MGLCVETLSEGTSIAGCSAPFSKRRAQGFSLSGFLLFCWWPSVSLIPTGVFRVSSPALSTHLSMPLRGPGSTQAQSLCFGPPPLLSAGGHSVTLVSAAPLDPGGAPTAVPTLRDGAQRQDLAQGRDLSTSRPVQAALQTWTLSYMWASLSYMWGSLSHMWESSSHMSGSLSHMWSPNRYGGRVIPAVSWTRGPSWSWSLHSLRDCDTEPESL